MAGKIYTHMVPAAPCHRTAASHTLLLLTANTYNQGTMNPSPSPVSPAAAAPAGLVSKKALGRRSMCCSSRLCSVTAASTVVYMKRSVLRRAAAHSVGGVIRSGII